MYRVYRWSEVIRTGPQLESAEGPFGGHFGQQLRQVHAVVGEVGLGADQGDPHTIVPLLEGFAECLARYAAANHDDVRGPRFIAQIHALDPPP
jgi:hypothetical protein